MTTPLPGSPCECEDSCAPQPTELDSLFASRGAQWWDNFYADKSRPVPFFCDAPDESLHEWIGARPIARGKALDIGSGNGRNSIFLAKCGFEVHAIDLSCTANDWLRQRADEAGVAVTVHHQSVFDVDFQPGGFDLIYDSGCFHHLPPHRRAGYVQIVANLLKPGGWFGLSCFRPEGGSGFTDAQVYERKSLGGGLGYNDVQLRQFWGAVLSIQVLRQMHVHETGSGLFGEAFLWALLAQKV